MNHESTNQRSGVQLDCGLHHAAMTSAIPIVTPAGLKQASRMGGVRLFAHQGNGRERQSCLGFFVDRFCADFDGVSAGGVELDLADNGCGFWEILRFGAVAPGVGCDGFAECIARNINAHFVAA